MRYTAYYMSIYMIIFTRRHVTEYWKELMVNIMQRNKIKLIDEAYRFYWDKRLQFEPHCWDRRLLFEPRCGEPIRSDKKNYNYQSYSCPRDWRLSVSYRIPAKTARTITVLFYLGVYRRPLITTP